MKTAGKSVRKTGYKGQASRLSGAHRPNDPQSWAASASPARQARPSRGSGSSGATATPLRPPAAAARAQASHSGSLCPLSHGHRSKIFPRAKTARFRFHEISGMSWCASARHAAARMPSGRHASGSTGRAISTPAARVSPTPKARAMTERQASGSTGADSRSPYGERQPHAEGERYLSAKGKAAAARWQAEGRRSLGGFLWAGEEGWCAGRFARGLPKECREKSPAHQPSRHGF
jgi:hypothetical protein